VKPDYRVLFRLFSTGYFKHDRDNNRSRDGIAEAKTLQGIALGRCRITDGMLFYCPHTKQVYTSSDFKLDEGRSTPTTFNLQYDGGIFVGLYDSSNVSTGVEPYPEGTEISMSTEISGKTVQMRGVVISVPVPDTPGQLPSSAADESPYVVRLVDGTIHKLSPYILDSVVVDRPSAPSNVISFPQWMGNLQKVMYLKNGSYLKGVMEFDLDSSKWRFSQRRRNGTELWGVDIPALARDYQKYVDDGILIPGWHNHSYFSKAGNAQAVTTTHVSARSLTTDLAPGSIKKALYSRNPDREIWKQSYDEEYDGLYQSDTFEIISEDEYFRLCRETGIKAIPSMCVFTVKKDSSGKPVRAKSRIVVLGNKDPRNWSKSDCYAPVISLPMVRMLTALAVQKRRTLKQGDCKLAFVQAVLPPEELTIVKPPVDCPRSTFGTYWRLKKSLYGLRRAPKHWFNLISSFLQSPEIGLQRCKNDPCVFFGNPIPGKPPLYLILYVDDFVYFSEDDDVESYFQQALQAKISVDFMGDAEWFIGMKFDWARSLDGHVDCRISQEAYIQEIVSELGQSNANSSPLMTPFRSGLPVDAIPFVEMSLTDRAPLIAKMQCWMGMMNWLTMGTRPDISTIVSLLASHTSLPSPGHLDAVKYLGRYLKSTADLGLLFSSRRNTTFEGYIYFPLSETDDLPSGGTAPRLTSFCDANWGPQDASLPNPLGPLRQVSIDESRSICGHLLMMGGCPIFWKVHKENRISRSSCEAEVKATDECVKTTQMFRHVLVELGLLDINLPTTIYNDNRGAVDWSNSSSTKGMRHVNIRENAVREAKEFNEVSILHIAGASNPSDLFSKEFKSDAIFRTLRGLLLSFPSSFSGINAVPRSNGGC
jgi:hypothetical protein